MFELVRMHYFYMHSEADGFFVTIRFPPFRLYETFFTQKSPPKIFSCPKGNGMDGQKSPKGLIFWHYKTVRNPHFF